MQETGGLERESRVSGSGSELGDPGRSGRRGDPVRIQETGYLYPTQRFEVPATESADPVGSKGGSRQDPKVPSNVSNVAKVAKK